MQYIKGWKDLTVGVYEKILTSELNPEDPDGIYELAGLVYGMSKDEVMELPLAETAALIKSLEFLQRKPRPILVKNTYKLGETEYEFKSEASQITTAQYIDFNNTTKDPSHMSELISVFLVPKGKLYGKGYDYRQVIEDVKNHLSVPEALSMSDFFLYRWESLLASTLKKTKRALKAARKDGAITKEQEKETAEKLEQLTAMYGSTTSRPSLT